MCGIEDLFKSKGDTFLSDIAECYGDTAKCQILVKAEGTIDKKSGIQVFRKGNVFQPSEMQESREYSSFKGLIVNREQKLESECLFGQLYHYCKH